MYLKKTKTKMYIYVHIFFDIYMYICMWKNIYLLYIIILYTCIHKFIYIHIHIYIYINIYRYTYIYIYIYIYVYFSPGFFGYVSPGGVAAIPFESLQHEFLMWPDVSVVSVWLLSPWASRALLCSWHPNFVCVLLLFCV